MKVKQPIAYEDHPVSERVNGNVPHERKKIQFKTPQGRLLAGAIVKRYSEYLKKKKYKPEVLYLGKFQTIIVENDERLQEFIADGQVVYSGVKSEVRFK